MQNTTVKSEAKTDTPKRLRSGIATLIGTNTTLMLAIALVIVGIAMMFNSPFGGGEVPSNPQSAILSPAQSSDGLLASLQDRARQSPDDSRIFAQLGVTYLQKSRETNDPTFYAQAEAAFKRALELDPNNYESMAGMGSLELARHNFTVALDWGQRAQVIRPSNPFAYGVIGDAYIELGKYPDAIDTFQRMIDLRPDLASYSRVSYARELYGEVDGAILAMQQAVSAGGLSAENTAWTRVQLGNLYFNSNRLPEAEQSYNEALQGYPNYLYAHAALANVRWAQGKTDEAITLYQKAVADVPLPHFVAALGDLYKQKGDDKAAQEQYELAEFIYTTQEVGGVDVDIEKSYFLSDRDMKLDEALILAQRAAQVRQDVNTLDALAWALYRTERYEEARVEMEKAQRLGTQNATFHYHMGMIHRALGDDAKAREHVGKALEINPHFSILHSDEARAFMGVSK